MELRPYQRDLVDEVVRLLALKCPSILLQMPTGAGKTATASHILQRVVSRGYRAIFVAHLDSLIGDTHKRLTAEGVHAGFIQGDRDEDPTAPVQVCSMQTLYARGTRPPCDVGIIDECQRSACASIQTLYRDYPKAYWLGLSATPERGDGQELGNDFKMMVHGPTVRWLISQGFLVPWDVLSPPAPMEGALSMDPVVAYDKFTPGSRAIVFCQSVEHAKDVTARFGERARLIIGSTPREERELIREQLTTGEVRVVVGVDVFIEGWDAPAVETVILARAFGHVGQYLQACGRGARPSPGTGKTRCVVLDLMGGCLVHGLPDEDRQWSLKADGVRRTEPLTALRRCKECFAIFRPATSCPRCGARSVASPETKLPRVLTRAESLERLSHLPQTLRDAKYLAALERIARDRFRFSDERAKKWAAKQFEKRFKRAVAA